MLEKLGSQISSATSAVTVTVTKSAADASSVVASSLTSATETAKGVTAYVVQQASTMTQQDAIDGAKSFTDGLVRGDFSKDESVSAHAGRVVGGLLPFVNVAGAVRDCAAHATRVYNHEKGAMVDLSLSVLGFIPHPSVKSVLTVVRGARTAMNNAGQFKILADKMADAAKAGEAAKAPAQVTAEQPAAKAPETRG